MKNNKEILKIIPNEIFFYQIHRYHSFYGGGSFFHFTWFADFECNEGDIITISGNKDYDEYMYNLEKFPEPISIKVKDIFYGNTWNHQGDLMFQHDVVKAYYNERFLDRFSVYFIKGQIISKKIDPLILLDKNIRKPWELKNRS